MSNCKQFECCECHESFAYDPAPAIRQRFEEFQSHTAHRSGVVVECPYCSASLYLDLAAGVRVPVLPGARRPRGRRGVFWDLSLAQEAKARVQELNREGNRLMAAGQFRTACGQFEQAIRLRKHDPLSWYHLGVSRMQDDDPSGAKEALRHALRCDSSCGPAWSRLGMILLAERKMDEACDAFDKGILADPECRECYVGKGNVCLSRGDVVGAKRWFDFALEKGESDPEFAGPGAVPNPGTTSTGTTASP
jgi:Flp pilus assembly protein TadD